MTECTRCGGYMPDRMFYTIGPTRRMSECKNCNKLRKAETYQPRERDYGALQRDRHGRFARKAA